MDGSITRQDVVKDDRGGRHVTDTTTGGPPTRRNVRGEKTRERLLKAALDSFAGKGFHGTSTRDIADIADMSPAAVYVHYRSKEDLLFALSWQGHIGVRDVIVAAAAETNEASARLGRIVHEFAAWHARFHLQARVIQYEMGSLEPEHREAVAVLRREMQALIRSVIVAGMENGSFRVDDVDTMARAILSLGIDVARWYRPDGTESPESIGRSYSAIALRMVEMT